MATYTTCQRDTSSNNVRSTRNRWAVDNATAVVAPSIYPNIADKDDVSHVWTITGIEPDGTA